MEDMFYQKATLHLLEAFLPEAEAFILDIVELIFVVITVTFGYDHLINSSRNFTIGVHFFLFFLNLFICTYIVWAISPPTPYFDSKFI
jgi:hypothetical protein